MRRRFGTARTISGIGFSPWRGAALSRTATIVVISTLVGTSESEFAGAAVELQSAMADLGARFQMDLHAAAGVASGWARVGRLGSGDSRDITAIGDRKS